MPTLPAILPITPAEGHLPVRADTDVEAVLPDFADPTAPVTSAIVEGLTALHLTWQEDAAYAAAQSDPTRNTGVYLDRTGEDRDYHRQQDELDEPYRDRIFALPTVVTPAAILAVATGILAPYSPILPQYVDGILDGLFLGDDSGPWHSFLEDVDPDYPDRLYDVRPQVHPGRVWLIPDLNGRYFILRIPVLADQGGNGAFLFDGQPQGAFLSDYPAGPLPVTTFLMGDGATALEVYQAVADSINAIRGQGVRWLLLADPLLH